METPKYPWIILEARKSPSCAGQDLTLVPLGNVRRVSMIGFVVDSDGPQCAAMVIYNDQGPLLIPPDQTNSVASLLGILDILVAFNGSQNKSDPQTAEAEAWKDVAARMKDSGTPTKVLVEVGKDTQRLDWLISYLFAGGQLVPDCHPDGPRAQIDYMMAHSTKGEAQ